MCTGEEDVDIEDIVKMTLPQKLNSEIYDPKHMGQATFVTMHPKTFKKLVAEMPKFLYGEKIMYTDKELKTMKNFMYHGLNVYRSKDVPKGEFKVGR